MERRLELEGWIAATRRNQRTLAIGIACATAVSLALCLWQPRIGLLGLALTAIVAICGFWVMAAHIADWRGRLAELGKPRQPPRTVGRRAD
jgi:hypothetical protein